MRTYQHKINGLALPHNVYMQIQYKIKDYDRLKKMRNEIFYERAAVPDGMTHSMRIGKPTEMKAMKLASLNEQIEAIDESADEVREKLSAKVDIYFDPMKAYWSYAYFNYVHKRKDEGDEGPSRRTWNYFKGLFSCLIAEKLKML